LPREYQYLSDLFNMLTTHLQSWITHQYSSTCANWFWHYVSYYRLINCSSWLYLAKDLIPKKSYWNYFSSLSLHTEAIIIRFMSCYVQWSNI